MKIKLETRRMTDLLLRAAQGGNVRTCINLLAHGLDINASDRFGRTALIAAVEKRRTKLVQELLKRGADPNRVISTRDALLPGHTALTIAVRLGDRRIFRTLLASKANANFQRSSGGTPLSYAASYGHTDILRDLLKAGAQLTGHVMDGAVRKGHETVVSLLLQAGADPNREIAGKEPLLAIACGNGHLRLVKLLMRFGANPNSAHRGLTPLIWSIIRGHDAVARWLLDHGASGDSRDNGGRTALHHAVLNQRMNLIKLLLNSGVDRTLKDSRGRTAEALALLANDMRACKLLELSRHTGS